MFGPANRSILKIHQYSSQCVKLSTSLCRASFNNVKVSKIMNKLLNNSKGKKRKFYEFPLSVMPKNFETISNHKTSRKSDRRQTVLNKLFMRSISDLMATGELCPEICDRGIQISKVNITSTLNQINVHWLASGNDDDIETENLLSELAPKLRHELSQLRMGVVPKIEFIKDSSYLKYVIVENILKTADYGSDFEPTPLANDWKSSDGLTLSQGDDIKESSTENESISEAIEDPLPVMRMDTFGLNYESIMKKINQSVQRAKAMHRRDAVLMQSCNTTEGNEAGAVLNAKERKKLFKEFILKKKLEWKKSVEKERKIRSELVIYEQDMEKNLADEFMQCYEEDQNEEFDRSCSYSDDYSRN